MIRPRLRTLSLTPAISICFRLWHFPSLAFPVSVAFFCQPCPQRHATPRHAMGRGRWPSKRSRTKRKEIEVRTQGVELTLCLSFNDIPQYSVRQAVETVAYCHTNSLTQAAAAHQQIYIHIYCPRFVCVSFIARAVHAAQRGDPFACMNPAACHTFTMKNVGYLPQYLIRISVVCFPSGKRAS